MRLAFGPGRALPGIRRVHRWLALAVGVQLLAWVVGGAYFSLTDIDWIHGDHWLRRPPPVEAGEIDPQAVALAVENACRRHSPCPLKRLDFVRLGEVAVIRVHVAGGDVRMFSAGSGTALPALGRDQAVALAVRAFIPGASVARAELLTRLPPGHEYRGHPLPAWAVHFDYPGHPVVYVAQRLGEVTAVRHDGWRLFDFLWMLHTLDFPGRDDINNRLLRVMAPMALLTVLSGYALYLVSRRRRRAVRRSLGE